MGFGERHRIGTSFFRVLSIAHFSDSALSLSPIPRYGNLLVHIGGSLMTEAGVHMWTLCAIYIHTHIHVTVCMDMQCTMLTRT
jgi:hypothetical protein